MIIDVENLDIIGVKLFKINTYNDFRGSFIETHKNNTNHQEFNLNYVQENESKSKFGVFRGMHFQTGRHSQSKLIRVVEGKIVDFFCDLRKSSKTFGEINFVILKPNNISFLPKGMAHGFLSLDKNTIINYLY